jgi:putative FmdB family regulatory protein
MPTYEFRCPEGHEFEKFYRSISAAPPEIHCPVCGKLAERILSAGGGLHFKGSGFYITDYGKDGKKQQTSPGGESGGSDAASKGETPKPESKPGESKGGSESKSAKPDKPAPPAKKQGGE